MEEETQSLDTVGPLGSGTGEVATEAPSGESPLGSGSSTQPIGDVTKGGWRDHIADSDIRQSTAVSEIKAETAEEAINALAHASHHAQKALGNKRTEVPREDWTSDQRSKWHQEVLGVPETFEGYDLSKLSVPENLEITPETQNAYVEHFHKLNMTDEQVNGVLSAHYELQSSMENGDTGQLAQSVKSNMDDLRASWGDKFEVNMDIAERGLKSLGSEYIANLMKNNPDIASNPDITNLFHQLGMNTLDDSVRGDALGNLQGTPRLAKLEQEIQEIETSQAWSDGSAVATNQISNDMDTATRAQAMAQFHNLKTRRTALYQERAKLLGHEL